MNKPKPCPFCGSPATGEVYYTCSQEKCTLHINHFSGANLEQWNSRPIEKELGRIIKSLKKLVSTSY